MSGGLEFVRGDPAGNITFLVLTPVPESARSAAARELLARCGGEQAGFLVPPILGGDCRLEMMGGEFCGNALRVLGRWWAEGHPGTQRLRGEISGCGHPLEITVTAEHVRAEIPLPEKITAFSGRDAVVFAGIVHLVGDGRVPTEEESRALTRRACEHFSRPAAGVMTLDRNTMTPVVYVRDTDTLYYESSCASGTAAAAAVLSRDREGESVFVLRQPGGTLTARALRREGELRALSVEGPVTLSAAETVSVRF